MKNLKIKLGLFSLLAVLAVSVFLTSCEQTEVTKTLSEEQSKIFDYIVNEYNFDADQVYLDETEFVADGMGFPIDNFWDNYTLPETSDYPLLVETEDGEISSRRHYRSRYKVTSGTYIVNLSSSLPWDIKNAARQAIAEWNALNLTVKFVERTYQSGYHINVYYTSTGCPSYHSNANWVLARAQYPQAPQYINGSWRTYPGAWVKVNSAYCGLGNKSASKKKMVLMHELGHTIGFRHTDSGDGTQTYSNHSFCNSFSDSESIMRSMSSENASFSFCDQDIFKRYY